MIERKDLENVRTIMVKSKEFIGVTEEDKTRLDKLIKGFDVATNRFFISEVLRCQNIAIP